MVDFLAFLVILLLGGAAAYAFLMKREADRRYAATIQDMADQEAGHLAEMKAARDGVKDLERFRGVPDILDRARRIEAEVAARLGEARRRGEEIVALADAASKRSVAEAARKVETSEEIARDVIKDAERRAFQERALAKAQAQEQLRVANVEADAISRRAHKEAREVVAKARADVKDKSQRAEDILSGATTYAVEIRANAEKAAETIAGGAYDALKRAEYFQSVAEAMRNATEGYGQRYFAPSATFLDDLAARFGFHETGERLRRARERIRVMLQNNTAAACDYPDATRRQEAINFVLDAFNGKVETALAKVRHNNVGALEQEIKDAFSLVNRNGKVFREARITDEFLAARLDELKWAGAVQRLKLRQREEQREIRERRRDEEKAAREYERELKRIRREEEAIQKALDKARLEFASSNLAERAKHEAEIRDLMTKLKETEEKYQRKKSLAEQTKRGTVYIISNVGSFGEGVYKIGLTRREEAQDRVDELGGASVPFRFDVHGFVRCEDAPRLENALHKAFVQSQVNKANPRKEFFRVGLEEIREAIEKLKSTHRIIDHDWTLAADASEYRKTREIERRLLDEPAYKMQWLADQTKWDETAEFDEESRDDDSESEDATVPASVSGDTPRRRSSRRA